MTSRVFKCTLGAEVQVCDFRGWRPKGLSHEGRQKQEERLSPPRRGHGEDP